MPRSWAELPRRGQARPEPEADARRAVLSAYATRSRRAARALTAELASAAFDPGDDAAWERLEEALIRADVGVPATAELVQRLEARGDLDRPQRGAGGGDRDAVRRAGRPRRRREAERPARRRRERHRQDDDDRQARRSGCGSTATPSSLAAADTFRAAAEEQLEIWADARGRRVRRRRARRGSGVGRLRRDRGARRAAVATSSSSTRPAACTRSRT